MIYGIGIDLVSVNRIKKTYDKFGQKFINKILTSEEKNEFSTKKHNHANFLAKKFAAKEAFVKALGSGFQGDFFFTDIGVEHDAQGKPILSCSSIVKEIMTNKSITNLNLSITDEKDNAIAIVILEI